MPKEEIDEVKVLLRMENISKSFPGVKALDCVSLSIKKGSVHALMGENGAGKSTLMKCLFGVYKKDSGRIILDGEDVDFQGPKDALMHGVAMVHQELNQALKLNVMDNMWLGRFPRVHPRLPIVSEARMFEMTKGVFDELGIKTDPRLKMSRLSVSERQMVEIAKAVSYNAKIIVFDEPTSSLNDKEAELLFSIIEKLKKRGCGIVYISHKMAEILRISDTVTVMRDGKHIATQAAKELTTDRIITLMVGRELKDRFPEKNTPTNTLLFEMRGVTRSDGRIKDVSLSLKRGEILGIAGLDGSGRTELLEAIFGLSKIECGELTLDGEHIENRSPIEAKKHGFALLTEERRKSGILGILNIKENATISSLEKFKSLILINDSKRNDATKESVRSMRIKTPNIGAKISSLSGGNQQKVILARWLLTEPRVLLLDEPTRGIDVGAKYEIYTLIKKLADEGRGVIVVSSEMPELLGMCHRIAVMSGGRVAGEVQEKDFSQQRIMELAGKYV